MKSRWQTILAIDSDPHACATYALNMPGVEVLCEPVVARRLPRADVVIGGPPCQPFSVAGKRAAGADARDAVPKFLAAIRRVRPRMFLMEQVPGFLTAEFDRYAQRIVVAMERSGYTVAWRVLDACHYGVPQRRCRAWFWGVRRSLGLEHRWPRPTHAWPLPEGDCMFGADLPGAVTVGEALELTGDIRRARGASVDRRDHPADEPCPTIGDGSGGSGSVLRVVGGGVNPRFAGDIRTERDITDEPSTTLMGDGNNALPCLARTANSPSPTITGGSHDRGGPEPIPHREREGFVRRLTPDECARLQSVPDDWRWPDGLAKTHKYRIVGNGWACGMAKHLSRALAEADPDSHTVIDLFCGGGLGSVGWHGRAWEYERDRPLLEASA